MTLSQVEELASQLPVEDQLALVEHLAHKLRSRRPAKAPQDLYGVLKGQFPEEFDIDQALKEIRAEWEKEWSEDGEFVG